MEDKEMIEEMANILCESKEHNCNGEDCKCLKQATDLFNKGARIIPENSIVISKEELEEKYEPSEKFMSVVRELEDLKQNLEDKVVLSREEYAELKQAKTLLEFREETIKYLEEANIRYSIALENKGKETAKEILESVNAHIPITLKFCIAKQFGVEIKE